MRKILLFLLCFNLFFLSCNTVSAERLANTFDKQGMGYTILYPEKWIYELQNKHTIIFIGPKESEEWYTTVNIQNLLSKAAGGNYENLQDVYQDFRNQFSSVNATILYEKSYSYTKDNNNLPGFEMKLEYKRNNETYRQWLVVIQRNANIFHQFSYTAPITLYDTKISYAVAMLDSWTLRAE